MPPARLLIVALALASLPARASAGTDQCARYAAWLDEARICQWGTALQAGYPLESGGGAVLSAGPPLRLVAVCGYTGQSSYFGGHFLFDGNVRVTGTLRLTDSESRGELVEFEVATPPIGMLPHLFGSVRMDEKKVKSRLRLPRLSASSGCWWATARMTLHTVGVEVSPGTGNDGAFAIRYAKLGAGRFSRCAE